MKTIAIKCSGTIRLSIHEMHEFQGELKSLSRANFEKFKKNIIKYGIRFTKHVWKNPKDEKYYIADGHQTKRVLHELEKEGYTIPKIPCTVVYADSEQEAKEVVLLANSHYGQIEEEGLYEFLEQNSLNYEDVEEFYELPEIDTDHFKANFYEDPSAGAVDGEDDVPEIKESFVKTSDLWQLGEHRLLCGDCTVKENVDRLMNGEKADMVYTDPPYGIKLDTDYSSMSKKSNSFRKVYGDDEVQDFKCHFEYFSDVKEQFWWGADYYAEQLPDRNKGSFVVWDKRQTSRTDIMKNMGSMDKMWGSCFELCWSRQKHKRDIARVFWCAGLGEGKDEDRTGRNNAPKRYHPTQKPIELVKWFFERWGKDKINIVDLYGGSGSTLIACEKTKRRCFMAEIDPHYCSVIIERWQKFTGKQAVKL